MESSVFENVVLASIVDLVIQMIRLLWQGFEVNNMPLGFASCCILSSMPSPKGYVVL